MRVGWLIFAAASSLTTSGRAEIVGHDCSVVAPLEAGSVRVERYVPSVALGQPPRLAWLPQDPPPRTLADARLYVILRPPPPGQPTRVFELVVAEASEAGRTPRWLFARMGNSVAQAPLKRFSRRSAHARVSLSGPAFEAAFTAGSPLEVFVLDQSGAVLRQRREPLSGRASALALAATLADEAHRKAADPKALCAQVTVEE